MDGVKPNTQSKAPAGRKGRGLVQTNDVTVTQETKGTITVEQLEGIIRRAVRGKLMELATQERGLFNLNKTSPLHKNMEGILERKNSISKCFTPTGTRRSLE